MPKRKPKAVAPEIVAPPAVIPPPVDPYRIEQAIRWILEGQREFDVIEAIKETWPDQDPVALFAECGAHFASAAAFNQAVIVGWCFAATMDVYRRMLAVGDLVGALRAIRQLRELAG